MAAPKAYLLLVDDRPDILAPLTRLLELQGYRVAAAGSGPEALEAAKREVPDLILLDVDMPQMNGFEVCRRLRAHGKTQQVPILFLSGLVDPSQKVEGLTAGGDDYVAKSTDFGELKARIEGLLRRHRRGTGANPVTGLPSPWVIEEGVTRRIIDRRPFALAIADIDDFKAYNDAYGYAKGDEALQVLTKVLREALDKEGGPDDLLAHAGADVFLVLSDPEKVQRIMAHVMEVFDWISPSFYKEGDREKGQITLKDRRGKDVHHPLMRLSIGAATTEKRSYPRYPAVLRAAGDVVRYVKGLKRAASFFSTDRRTS